MQPEEHTEQRQRERGSILILTAITLAVIIILAATYVTGSVTEGKAASESVEHSGAWFGAQGGIWAIANDLSNDGTGNISGSTVTGYYSAQSSSDSDGDGFPDFSSRAVFLAASEGYFEGRVKSLGGDKYLIRARAVDGTTVRTVESYLEPVPDGSTPGTTIKRGGFGDAHFHNDSNVITDSYNSDDDTYKNHTTTTTFNGNKIKNQNGGIASNGNISMDSNSKVFGNATPGVGKTVTLNGSAAVTGTTTPLTAPEPQAAPTWTVPSTSDTFTKLGIAHGGNFSKGSGTTTINGSAVLVLNKLELDGSGKLVFNGDENDVVEIYITGGNSPGADPSFKMDSNSELKITPYSKLTGPTIKIYNVGKMELNSNSQLHTNIKGNPSKHYAGDPIQFQYYSTYASQNTSDIGVHFNSNNNTSGVFYAPDAVTTYDSNSELWGAVVGERIEFNSNVFLHYDESLSGFSPASDSTPEYLYVPAMSREVR